MSGVLLKLLAKLRRLFESPSPLARLYPVYRALDNFLFAAPETTANAPYGRDPIDVKRYMSVVIVALFPSMLAAVYFFGWRVLLALVVSYVAGGTVEVLFAVIRKEEINEGFLVTGFIFPLILPPALPLWMVAVGVVFGVVVGKEVFGGTGRNLFNPALVGRAFLALGYPAAMASTWVQPGRPPWGRLLPVLRFGAPADALTSATPLAAAKGGDFGDPLALFLGFVPGSAGETSVPAIVLGGLFLLVVGVASWRTVLSVLASFAALNALLRAVAPGLVSPVWFNLATGGILFGAFFMATDPVSSPVTLAGKWLYGALIGAATILIRSFSGFVEGAMFAILFGNICAPLIDEVLIRARMRRYAREG